MPISPARRSKEDVMATLNKWTKPTVLSELTPDALTTLFSLADHYTKNDIERSYKRLALFAHPDRNPDAQAAEQFQLLTAARDYLNQGITNETDCNNVFYKVFNPAEETPACTRAAPFEDDYSLFETTINQLNTQTDVNSPDWSTSDLEKIETLKRLINKLKTGRWSSHTCSHLIYDYNSNLKKLLQLVIQKQSIDFFKYLLTHVTLSQYTYKTILQAIDTHNRPEVFMHVLEHIDAIEKSVEVKNKLKGLLQKSDYSAVFTYERIQSLIEKNPRLLNVIDSFQINQNEKDMLVYRAVCHLPFNYPYLNETYTANPFVLTLALCSLDNKAVSSGERGCVLNHISEHMNTKYIAAFAYLWPEVNDANLHASDGRREHPYSKIQYSLLHYLSMPSEEVRKSIEVCLFYLVLIIALTPSFASFSLMNALILPVSLIIAAVMIRSQLEFTHNHKCDIILIILIILPSVLASLLLSTTAPIVGTLTLALAFVAFGRIAQRCYLNSELSEISEHIKKAEEYRLNFFPSFEARAPASLGDEFQPMRSSHDINI